MAEKKNAEKKKMNPLLWFLFVIVIPLIIVISLVMIVLNVAGFDIVSWAKEKGNNIPVVANVVTTEDEKNVKDKELQLQATIDNKNQEIDELTQNIGDLESVINNLEKEITQLEQKENEQNSQDEASEPEQLNEPVTTIAKSYEEMDSEQAAVILENMEDRTSVVSILNEVPNDTRGEILQEMDPEVAADLTQRLMSDSN